VPALFKSKKPHREMVLYAHFPCFDGVASAALAKTILEMGSKSVVRRVVPVTYDVRARWLSTRLEKHAVVVDFLFHPEAEYWADHHTTTFLDESAVEVFRSRDAREKWLYDPSARSCCSVIWHACGPVIENHQLFEELVKWADKIDSAAYVSVDEAILGEEPALRINTSLLVDADAAYFAFLVDSLSKEGIAVTAQNRKVGVRVKKARERITRGLHAAKRAVKLEGGVAVLRADETADSIVSRYAPYWFFPNARYSIMSTHSAGMTKVTAMRNPWIQFESVPLGPLFAQFGGGGHDRVGSVELRNSNSQVNADEVLAYVLRALQGNEVASHHETVFA
jgi:hypothetical protein